MMDVFQWRIQDFPDGEATSLSLGQKPIFDKIIVQNCIKMKEIGPRGRDLSALLGFADTFLISGTQVFFPRLLKYL